MRDQPSLAWTVPLEPGLHMPSDHLLVRPRKGRYNEILREQGGEGARDGGRERGME